MLFDVPLFMFSELLIRQNKEGIHLLRTKQAFAANSACHAELIISFEFSTKWGTYY
jgi:hypothetical protein